MKHLNRRDFLKLSGASLIGVTFGGVALRAHAEQVDPTDPQAAALKYTHESKVEGQYCNNCAYIQAQGEDWLPCALFPGKKVSSKGWCNVWTKKP